MSETNDIQTVERIFNGMLSEDFAPSDLVRGLYNVLACGEGHKKAGLTVCRNDETNFEKMMKHISKAGKLAQKIE